MSGCLLRRKWQGFLAAAASPPLRGARSFRSKAALEALCKASEDKVPNIVLYNYPSFSGAFSALFARLFHSRLNLPCLVLPFSSVVPLRVEDIYAEGLEKCYFLDFLGPKGFAVSLSGRSSCQIIGFDHRKSALSKIPPTESAHSMEKIRFHVDLKKSSSSAVYEFFSARLAELKSPDGELVSLLHAKDRHRVEMILKYMADVDLRQWSLPDNRAFNIGLGEWRTKLNCITNPYMFEQLQVIYHLLSHSLVQSIGLSIPLSSSSKTPKPPWSPSSSAVLPPTPTTLPSPTPSPFPILKPLLPESPTASIASWASIELVEMNIMDVVSKGNSYISSRATAANKVLDKVFKLRLGRGIYGECLGVRADGNSDLADEIGKQLSEKSAAARLRPIGAVVYMQRNNLKMCLRSTDCATDTSEIAKAYGGGGFPSSSSFIIRMDEYNQWVTR